MKLGLHHGVRFGLAAGAMLFVLAPASQAHRLDEYLQATLFSLAPGRVEASMRLVPGVRVAPWVIAGIDTDGDGVFSAAEQNAYAQRVLGDLTLKVDGLALPLSISALSFPPVDELKQGLGEIRLGLRAELPKGQGMHVLRF